MVMTKSEERVQQIKNELLELGPMLPGHISKQYNVCGKPKCRCKDPDNPVKHGPYYYLGFTILGKSSSMFIKERDLDEAQSRIKNYQRFKELRVELIRAYVDLARDNGLTKRG
jgi:hypothetical protein